MFCPICGNKKENLNERYCSNCGNEFPLNSGSPQIPSGGPNYATINPSQNRPANMEMPPIQQISPELKSQPKPNSTKCFIFSIVSIAIAIAALIISGPFLFYHYFLIGFVISIICHTAGLIMGILAKIFSNKAQSEIDNALETIGNIFSYFGIVFNAIGIGASLIALPILIAITR